MQEATIWYVHRGAPGDYLKIPGAIIKNLDNYFFETEDSSIPYHRILRIDHRGEVIFLKDGKARDLE